MATTHVNTTATRHHPRTASEDQYARLIINAPSGNAEYLPTIHSAGLSASANTSSLNESVQPDAHVRLTSQAVSCPQKTNAHLRKPQRKQTLKGLRLGGRNPDTHSTESFSNGSQIPLDSIDTETGHSSTGISRSISKDNIVKLFGRNAREKDDSNAIDLSLSMEENERRSGITISSNPRNAPGIGFHQHTRSFSDQRHQHSRSFSNGSVAGMTRRSSFATIGTESATDEESDSRRRSLPRFKFPSSASYSDYNMAANADGFNNGRQASFLNRNRSQTYDETMSMSMASSEHASSERKRNFRRARTFSNKTMPPMDPETRRMAIEQARREWRERQDAKNRKYEEQERKAQEKKDRKLHKQQEKNRKKSDVSAPPRVRPTRLPSVDSDIAHHSQRRTSCRSESAGIFKWCKLHLLHI